MNTNVNHKKRIASIPKKALSPREVGTIQSILYSRKDWRGLALFRGGIDTMFRASDLVRIQRDEILDHQNRVKKRFAIVMKKTGDTVEVVLSRDTISAFEKWLEELPPFSGPWLFPGGTAEGHISEKHYRSMAKEWFKSAGLDARDYSTHSIRRTKPTEIYRQTQNLKSVSLMLGHRDTKVTERYLGIDRETALDLAEKIRI